MRETKSVSRVVSFVEGSVCRLRIFCLWFEKWGNRRGFRCSRVLSGIGRGCEMRKGKSIGGPVKVSV